MCPSLVVVLYVYPLKINTMKHTFFFFSLLAIFTSCSHNLTPFNQDLYDKYRWSSEDLKNIQFYLSKDIVLYKKQYGSEASIADGKINIKSEKKGERVVIKRGTPGAFIFSPKNNRFAISFNDNDDSKYLMFGPNNALNGKYALLAKEWEKHEGTVTYNNESYVVDAHDALSILLVDLRKISKEAFSVKEEKGRKI